MGPRHLIRVICPLDGILLLSLLAVVAGAETFTAIALFGKKKLDRLRRFRPFANGTPDHDRLGEVFAAPDAEQFQKCFVSWVASLTGAPEDVIAIDGKTSRRASKSTARPAGAPRNRRQDQPARLEIDGKTSRRASNKGGLNPIHMVPAFAARQRPVLGQVKVAQKSNAIVAIPELLDMLAIEGAIVTIDAMGCQRGIASRIIASKADDMLALKGNQGTLREDVERVADAQKASNVKDATVSRNETADGDHGRIETRRTTVVHDIGWLRERHDWPGPKAVVMVQSKRETGARVARETRFYLTASTSPPRPRRPTGSVVSSAITGLSRACTG